MTTMAEKELVVPKGNGKAMSKGSESAKVAGEDLEPQLKELVTSYAQKLKGSNEKYKAQVTDLQQRAAKREAEGLGAGPISFFGLYPWWNLLVVGPFQAPTGGGPYRPSKIVRHGEPAFMVVALWRNPLPLPGGGPSAAAIMSPFNYSVQGEMINLSNVAGGPDFAPVGGVFGGGNINLHVMPIPTLPVPSDGKPDLYEVNFTMDILGPAPGLPPFAGYATWVFDPDNEPPFILPQLILPDGTVTPVIIPGAGPQLQHDVPARFLIYV